LRLRPAEQLLEGCDSARELSPEQLELLLALVESHGEAVDRRSLKQRVWPVRVAADHELRAVVRSLGRRWVMTSTGTATSCPCRGAAMR